MSNLAAKRRNIKIPSWAPQDLYEFYRRLYDDNIDEPPFLEVYLVQFDGHFDRRDESSRDMLERMLTRDEMKGVWRELRKKTTKTDIGTLLLIMVGKALLRMRAPRETRAQKRRRYLRIVNEAKSFSNSIRGSELDVAIPRPRSQTLWKLLEKPLAVLSTPDGSRISELVDGIAKEAEFIAQRANDKMPLLPRPGITNPDRVAFIRALAEQFVSEFGSPLYGTLATVTRVCLDDPYISQETVKDALRTYPLN